MEDTVAAPTDIQQTGTATYTGRHRDPWNRDAAPNGHEPKRDLMPSGDTVDDWYAPLKTREQRRTAQNGSTR